MSSQSTKIAALLLNLATTPLLAQHVDILAYDADGKVGVGEFNFDTQTANERRVHLARFNSLYSVDNPGFTSLTGPDALPGNQELTWNFLPMSVDAGPHAGYRSTLLYWDGSGEGPNFGPTATDEYEFSFFGQHGNATATGRGEIEPGSILAPTPPNGSIHEHPFYFLDDNGDGLNTTLPNPGIYVIGLQLSIAGLEPSDPVFMVWATPEISVLPAIQPAAAWVRDRVDSLVVEPSAGDFDVDGDVDGTDFLLWQQQPSVFDGATGLSAWSTNYAATDSFTQPVVQVPEPATLGCFTLAWMIVLGIRRRPARLFRSATPYRASDTHSFIWGPALVPIIPLVVRTAYIFLERSLMKQRIFSSTLFLIALTVVANSAKASPEPGTTLYHVGYDNSEFVAFGTYTGLPNPNYQRLTFLFSHTFLENPASNHFHWIGQYSYSGDPLNPQPGFSTNDQVPERYQQDDGLALLPGTGAFSGKYVSGLGPAERAWDIIELEYGDTTIYPIDELFQYDNAPDPDGEAAFHPSHYLLNTLDGAFKQSVADTTIGLKLVGISPGLSVYDTAGNVVMDAIDDSMTLGTGADWSFEPVFAVDGPAAAGESYEATFILQDLSTTPTYGDSAEFTFRFITVPEPAGLLLALVGIGATLARRM